MKILREILAELKAIRLLLEKPIEMKPMRTRARHNNIGNKRHG